MRRGRHRRDDEYGSGWPAYVPVAERRQKAERAARKLEKKGQQLSPIVLDGRAIARTFWGRAWCDNLEGYGDFANRIPRGRAYVRNGSVIDLRIAEGIVAALVSGTRIYEVKVTVAAVPNETWTSLCADCAGGIDSLVELLQGRFSRAAMDRICRQRTGLFPSPGEIRFSCSCPDWASMCKHVAATLYGVGARLDVEPELLFRLRAVDGNELVALAGAGLPLGAGAPSAEKLLDIDDLSALFGVEIATAQGKAAPKPKTKRKRAKAEPEKTREPKKGNPPKRSRASKVAEATGSAKIVTLPAPSRRRSPGAKKKSAPRS
ncbi:MAG: hypothetical protein M0R80_10375 [Proteobacteria bacterium]|jgi:uncharacterized Zn finger protein|nr:hypothetical protein [Pseudomonadota bacterium]